MLSWPILGDRVLDQCMSFWGTFRCALTLWAGQNTLDDKQPKGQGHCDQHSPTCKYELPRGIRVRIILTLNFTQINDLTIFPIPVLFLFLFLEKYSKIFLTDDFKVLTIHAEEKIKCIKDYFKQISLFEWIKQAFTTRFLQRHYRWYQRNIAR